MAGGERVQLFYNLNLNNCYRSTPISFLNSFGNIYTTIYYSHLATHTCEQIVWGTFEKAWLFAGLLYAAWEDVQLEIFLYNSNLNNRYSFTPIPFLEDFDNIYTTIIIYI